MIFLHEMVDRLSPNEHTLDKPWSAQHDAYHVGYTKKNSSLERTPLGLIRQRRTAKRKATTLSITTDLFLRTKIRLHVVDHCLFSEVWC